MLNCRNQFEGIVYWHFLYIKRYSNSWEVNIGIIALITTRILFPHQTLHDYVVQGFESADES